VFNSTTLTIC